MLVAKGYPDIGWNPVEGERYLDFLRFAVFCNGNILLFIRSSLMTVKLVTFEMLKHGAVNLLRLTLLLNAWIYTSNKRIQHILVLQTRTFS